MSGRGAAGEGAAGCNDKNKNPTIECGEKKVIAAKRIYHK